ncbi:MAG: hypothetical protein HY654_08975 [Acidobacteria bacterium]|nr:hypothetical protein [Acidobacteriota bacterium]
MSEGVGSWRAANVHAKQIGLDVLWWSDHDWRMAYHTYNRAFGFEGPDLTTAVPTYYEPGTDLRAAAGNEPVTITLAPHKFNGHVKDAIARTTTQRATEGTRSLEVVAAAAGPGWQPYLYEIDSTRRRMKRSLASKVTLSFAAFTDAGDEVMAAVRVDLSQQPPDMKAGALYYVLTQVADADLKTLEDAHTKVIRLPFEPGSWNRVNVDVTRDAERLQLGGIDNAIVAVSFGVVTRGPLARAFFDDYRIHHELQGERLREEARAMAARYQKEYGVINYVGQELSFQAHMNPIGERVPMIDYIKHPAGLTARETSDFVHANGGILSLNHIFGTNRPAPELNPKDPDSVRRFEDARIRELTENRVYGADILEVGYPTRVLPMTSFLRVWDALSAAGIDVVGNGTSDTHGSIIGWYDGNNFVSWVWTRSASMADIVDGFRRGDVYFGDPVQFKGTLTLTTDDGHRMGSVVLTRKPEHRVNVGIEGLPAGARVRMVTNGQAGAEDTPGRPVFEKQLRVDTSTPAFVRVEAYTAEGRPLVFSNPIYFRPEPSGTVSAYKRVLCP